MLQVNLRQAIHKTTSSVNTIPSPVISRPTTRLLPGIHPSLSLEEEDVGIGRGKGKRDGHENETLSREPGG